MQQPLVSEEDVLPDQQDWKPSLDQKDSQPPNIKEEQEELWSEDEEKPQSLQLYQRQRDESTEVELLASSLTEYRTLKIEADGEDCGGSQPARDSGPCSHLQPHTDDMQQPLMSKEDVLHEQQEWKRSLDQKDFQLPNIKEEQEDFWSEDEEKPQSLQLYQRQRDESTEVELLASSSTEHRTLKIEADEEDCGGSQPARDSGPCSHFQPDTDDMQHLLVSKEDVLLEQQDWNQSLDQKDSWPPNIKEEQEELWSDDEEKPQSLQLYQRQRDESTEVELFASNLTEYRTLKIEADEEDCGGSQPARDSGPCSHFQPDTDDMQQLLVIKEEILPEEQEWNLSADQEDIKEQEKFWIGQEGQQLHQLEEADITRFPFTVISVKIENDDDDDLQSSQVHQSQSHESREAEPVASNSMVHRTLTAQAEGEDCGGPQPAGSSGPYSRLHPVINGRTSDSSETESDESYEWNQNRNFCSGFNFLKNSNVSVSPKKQLHWAECEKACDMSDSKQHKGRQASEKPFSCPNGGKGWRQKATLNRQMRINSGEKPYGCSECGKRFGQKCNLDKHVRIHTGEKPFGCSECDKRFREKCNLNKHMKIHTGEKTFSCAECGKRFRQKCHLNTHKKIHIVNQPFGCSECGKRFREKGNLTKHMSIHTGEKTFGCSECGKRFREKGNLTKHMSIHTGEKTFHCAECGKSFRQKCYLNAHMKIHTGEKTFGCSACGKTFRQKCHLNKHMRIHTGNKPFGCSLR